MKGNRSYAIALRPASVASGEACGGAGGRVGKVLEPGEPMARKTISLSEERPTSRQLGVLARLWPFLRPYRWQMLAAMAALAVAAGTVLALGFGVR